MKKLIALLLPVLFTGCQHMSVEDISEIDTSNKQPACVRQCTASYSDCVGEAFGIAAQNSCGNAYKICINTCPATE